MFVSSVVRSSAVGSQEGGGREQPDQWLPIMYQQWTRWGSVCSSLTRPCLRRKTDAMAAWLTN